MKISFGCQTYTWKLNKERFAGDLPHIADVTAKAGYTGLESEIDMLGDYFNRAELTKSIDDAYLYARKIIAEHAITKLREINCAVLG